MNPKIKKMLSGFLREDLGTGDITSKLLTNSVIRAKIVSRESGVVAGVIFSKELFVMNGCTVEIIHRDGQRIRAGSLIFYVHGPLRSILSVERTALNLMSRMSGVATATQQMKCKVNGRVKILATRKTMPGMRFFDKEAVQIGGGFRHRMSLSDRILIKDNHLSADSMESLILKAKRKDPKFEIEVDSSLDTIRAAKLGARFILLDNFTPKQIRHTITLLKKYKLRKNITLEASGGITLKNISAYSKTGVDFISSGVITNSAHSIDYSLEM
ncbi:MAG: carboxylating nicotinate-nucleotide diphosphorylase [Candidatus Nitrosoabyssus spongiisocia]|nr:MAG: carboxylating nicotinate-nucleotide diphosphorylase [Nitrosopumilaceae archaeon AB1(1)]